MGCIQSGRAEHPPKRENVGLDSAQTTFSFQFWSQPQADRGPRTAYFNLGRTHCGWFRSSGPSLWQLPALIGGTREGMVSIATNTKMSARRQEGRGGRWWWANCTPARDGAREGECWAGEGGQVCGEQPLHPSCDKALPPHADGPPGPQAASWSTAWGKDRNSWVWWEGMWPGPAHSQFCFYLNPTVLVTALSQTSALSDWFKTGLGWTTPDRAIWSQACGSGAPPTGQGHLFLPICALLSHRGPSLHQTSASSLSGFRGCNPFIPRITNERQEARSSAPMRMSA